MINLSLRSELGRWSGWIVDDWDLCKGVCISVQEWCERKRKGSQRNEWLRKLKRGRCFQELLCKTDWSFAMNEWMSLISASLRRVFWYFAQRRRRYDLVVLVCWYPVILLQSSFLFAKRAVRTGPKFISYETNFWFLARFTSHFNALLIWMF